MQSYEQLIDEQLRVLRDKLVAHREEETRALRAEILKLKGLPPDRGNGACHFEAAKDSHPGFELPGCPEVEPPGCFPNPRSPKMADHTLMMSGSDTTSVKKAEDTFMRSGSAAGSAMRRTGSGEPKPSGLLDEGDVAQIQELRKTATAEQRQKEQVFADNSQFGLARFFQPLQTVKKLQSVSNMRLSLMAAEGSRVLWMRALAVQVVSQPFFDISIGLIILIHSICIGVETTHTVDGGESPQAITVLDRIFLLIYILELLARFFAFGVHTSLKSNWIRFDAFLVGCGIIDFFISVAASKSNFSDLMLIRILRISRLARTARLMVQFRTLWMLVQGLLHSVLTLLWTFLIIIVLCYIFAILGMEVFKPSDDEYGDEYETSAANFRNLTDAMITMFQMLTLDSVAGVYRPLIKAKPTMAGLYFIAFLLIIPIALLNLVTAIMVESSMRQANQDQEAKRAWEDQTRRQLLPKLEKLFNALDEDGSGEVDWGEIDNASQEAKDQMRAICNGGDLEDIFNQLDYDHSGSVDITEFCEGLLKAGSEKPVEFHCIMRQCTDIIHTTRRSLDILEGKDVPVDRPSMKVLSRSNTLKKGDLD